MKKILLLAAASLMTLGVAAQSGTDSEKSVTFGDYDNLKESGSDDDGYDGSFYDRAPTTFYMEHTGSQLIYTKEDLAALAGDSITGISFLGYNNGLFEQPSRTVNIFVKEIPGSTFTDAETGENKFFDYTDGTKVLSDYQYSDDEFVNYAYSSYELNLPFSKPVYYSGENNLLVTVTFDGEACGGNLDFNFYANKDRKKQAMTYTSSDVSFADYEQTDDWPGRTSQTSAPIELPVSKINYKEAEAPAPGGEVVSNYLQDFNRTQATTKHDFAPSGWSHIVDSLQYGSETSYVEYSYNKYNGVDGSACLRIGSQNLSDYFGNVSKRAYDLLVTPPVTGVCTLQVKSTSWYNADNSHISFWKVTRNDDGTFTRGDSIAVDVPEIQTDNYVTVTLPAAEANSYIGIRGEYVYIDNFTAESAIINKKAGLTVSDVTLYSTNNGWTDADADGNYTLTFNVSLKNTGDVALDSTTANYNVTLLNVDSTRVLGTYDIPTALDVDGTTTFKISKTLNIKDYPDINAYTVRENITGTTGPSVSIRPYPYTSEFRFTESTDTKALTSDTLINFGVSKDSIRRSFYIRNLGAKPLAISSVTVPDGFFSNWTGAQTIDAHSRITLNVTMTNETAGKKSGNITITGDSVDFTLPITGFTVAADQMFYDFESGDLPTDMIYNSDKWAISSYPRQVGLPNNKYCLAARSVTTPERIILPKVEVAQGEQFSFDAAQQGGVSYLNVYYSADRKSWTKVLAITSDTTATDAEKFSQDVAGQDYYGAPYYKMLTYTARIPEGQWYIAFESGYAFIDNVFAFHKVDLDHDIDISSTEIPLAGSVNREVTAKATFHNVNDKNEAADGYTANLYLGDEKMATATSVDLDAWTSGNFEFAFTPHKTGEFKAYVTFETEGYKQTSDTTTITISEESAQKDVVVGNPAKQYSGIPIYTYDKNSESETHYTPELLGIPAGTKIDKITYNGMNTSGEVTRHITVWMENIADTAFDTLAIVPTENMTKVYDSDYTIPVVGSRNNSKPLLVLPLTAPFEYTGNVLRVIVHAEGEGFKSLYFDVDDSQMNKTIARSTDYDLNNITPSYKPMPVVVLTVETEARTLSGKVTDQNNDVVAGAVVTLTSGDVIYSDTTDAEGNYSISVAQDEKEYNVTATAEGYEPYASSSTITFDNADATLDIQMTKIIPDGIDTINGAAAVRNGAVYDLMARKVLDSADRFATLPQGIYIVNGKKVVKK